jgi:O-antigen/teichoic acid export membrane protein
VTEAPVAEPGAVVTLEQSEALVRATAEGSVDGAESHRFARDGAITVVFSGLTLATNVVTGVLVARALGTEGRGQLAAILTVTQLVGWAFTFGCAEAMSYRQARHRDNGGVVGAWLVLVVPAGLAAAAVGEAVLPAVLHAQTGSTLALARLFVLSVVFTPFTALTLGILLGTHRYLLFNLIGFVQPLLNALFYIALWRLGRLSPGSALVVTVCVSVAVALVLALQTLPGRVSRPDWEAGLSSVWYGIRAHGTNLGGMATSRFDLMIIPAFLAASSVGLYSVATNVSWIIVSTTSALAAIVLPAAARDPQGGVLTVVRSLQATFAFGAVCALAITGVAEIALRTLYGASFERAGLPLRILLPGAVCYACGHVLWSGLYALERPLTAAACQAVGVVFTVGGLLLFLRRGGIVAAALVSTASYAVTFVLALVLYRRAAGLGWRAFFALPDHPRLASLTRVIVSRL